MARQQKKKPTKYAHTLFLSLLIRWVINYVSTSVVVDFSRKNAAKGETLAAAAAAKRVLIANEANEPSIIHSN